MSYGLSTLSLEISAYAVYTSSTMVSTYDLNGYSTTSVSVMEEALLTLTLDSKCLRA